MSDRDSEENWDLIIQPHNKWYNLQLNAIWKYKDLLFLFVKRDFISVYKQTILGPVWLFLQPILTTITFTIIFSNVAKISTDGIPSFLFYLSGITLWTYFADCLTKTSTTFTTNAGIFGKVYFPRFIMPLSVLISNLVKLGIQFLLFVVFWVYFLNTTNGVHPNAYLLLFPVLIIIMAGLGMGFGIIISALTTKYRDLAFLVGFGVQLLMYASPIVYPLSTVPKNFEYLLLLNPVTSIIEAFKYGFIGVGFFSWGYLCYSFIFMILLLTIGMIVFNKVEKSFMDTV
jgi:lipopolysaccharide transport system permease protein